MALQDGHRDRELQRGGGGSLARAFRRARARGEFCTYIADVPG